MEGENVGKSNRVNLFKRIVKRIQRLLVSKKQLELEGKTEQNTISSRGSDALFWLLEYLGSL